MTYPVRALGISQEILDALERGEQVTITKENGEPVADLVPHKRRSIVTGTRVELTAEEEAKIFGNDSETPRKKQPKFGTLKGHKVVIDPNWDRPQNDIDAFLRGDV